MSENENIKVIASEEQPIKKKKKTGRKILAVLLVIIVAVGLCVWSVISGNNQLEKKFYQVKSDKVVDNIRVVCIADMHLKEFGIENTSLVNEIKSLSPDIIAIVGDMNHEDKPHEYDSVVSLCKKLNAVAPVYYSLGNHEIDAMLFSDSKIYDDLKAAGIKVFNNESETITVGGTPIDVIGLTQGPSSYNEYGRKFFEGVMENDENFKLVLTHYPENFQGVIEEYNIDLALSGHAHGGLVRLPWIGGLYAPDQGLLPELESGYHEIENSKVVITRGLGKSGIIPRINNKPEIAVVDIGWY